MSTSLHPRSGVLAHFASENHGISENPKTFTNFVITTFNQTTNHSRKLDVSVFDEVNLGSSGFTHNCVGLITMMVDVQVVMVGLLVVYNDTTFKTRSN